MDNLNLTEENVKVDLKVDFTYLPVLNFALQQNKIKVIRDLVIENKTDKPLQNVVVEMKLEPNIGSSVSFVIDAIEPYAKVRPANLAWDMTNVDFVNFTERLEANIGLSITASDVSIFTCSYPISILAFDQWGGVTVMPEVLVAFVTPNHPALAPILKRTAEILHKWTSSASLDAYQSKSPDRVNKQVAALYAAISELNIIYSTAPASFENTGQRIRLIDTILNQKLANCLEMSILFASCLEAMSLHPLLVLTNGHAFAGAWLIEDVFADSVIDDYSLLSKLMADGIKDLALVETTCMCYKSETIPFESAEGMIKSHLNAKDFILSLDVCRCRLEGIRPLPLRISNGKTFDLLTDDFAVQDHSDMKPITISRYDLPSNDKDVVWTKQMMWERKLLDLSLRNNLLNLRITKNTLQFLTVETYLLEDNLAKGNDFALLAKPQNIDLGNAEFGLYENIDFDEATKKSLSTDLKQNKIRTLLSDRDLEQTIKQLYRNSKASLEENGANTLFIAMGALKWYESKSSDRPRYAPIILIPVEIIRKSAGLGYVLRSRDEDTMLNITLMEMLRQNFNITIPSLDLIPTDDNGVDVKLILSVFRNAIKTQSKWDILDTLILGVFSFSKFIMWNDIHNNSEKLSQNKVVSSLINGKIEWDIVAEEEAIDLDTDFHPNDVLLPVSADSSQLLAVVEAVKGRSFILHGPPGTGKSQTITNLISNALYAGKRVLFVAEKMAALAVVQKRLEAIGLAPFCLELHSNKAKKSAILEQLKNSLEVTKNKLPETFLKESEKIFHARQAISGYLDDIHVEYPFGFSLYQAIVRYENLDVEEVFAFDQDWIQQLNKEHLETANELLRKLVSALNVSDQPATHPLKGIAIDNYNPQIKDAIEQQLSATKIAIQQLQSSQAVLSNRFGKALSFTTLASVSLITRLVNALNEIPELTAFLLTTPSIQSEIEEWEDVIVHGIEKDRVKENILRNFNESFLQYDVDQGLRQWQEINTKWFLPKYFASKKFLSSINAYAIGKKVDADNVNTTFQELQKYQKEKSVVDNQIEDWNKLFGKFGRKDKEDWKTIQTILDHVKVIDECIMALTEDIAAASSMKQQIAQSLSDGVGAFRRMVGADLEAYLKAAKVFDTAYADICQKANLSNADCMVMSFDDFSEKINTYSLNINKLKDWYQWLTIAREFKESNLGFVVDYLATDTIPIENLIDTFSKGLYKSAINHIMSDKGNLQIFDGRMFSDTILHYRNLIDEYQKLTREELVARLSANLPNFTLEASQNSEVGILQKNIRNNGRGMSIRKLFDQIPILLSRLCPCMMMSPISVAQYIDVDAEKFDLIVFDEASQMPTYESIGAIARGNSVVIVGDPKQMPPTSFFTTGSKDEENIELEDLDSILDDCLALSMPSKYLLWHYRSRHESLISFSNSEYYDNKLNTFPSPDNILSKVSYVPVNGVYEKGKTRQNKAEAQAIIQEIDRRLRDPKLRKQSIGVVTFSIVQQMLIEDMLSDLFALDHNLESIALAMEEPIFIKNLENVQGDERDVILFSICYGPDENGNVSMNFGPLNREGGERRLNVAVTRARYEMIIYATLKPEQIDLNRTSSLGVAGMKRFLEFAQSRQSFGARKHQVQETESINEVIAQKLRKLGYQVDTNIGSSAYKIDLAIVNKEVQGSYLLGIICDGFKLHHGETIRDREIVQPGVLKGLGWKMHRVWSLDWYENEDKVIEGIIEVLNNNKESVITTPISTIENNLNAYATPTETANEGDDNNNGMQTVNANVFNSAIDSSRMGRRESIMALRLEYAPHTLKTLKLDAEALMMTENKNTLQVMLQRVIKEEYPISKSLLMRKMLTVWGIAKMSPRVSTYLDTTLQQLDVYTSSSSEDSVFVWPSKDAANEYTTFRVNSDRDITDIAPEEFANAMRYILVDNISLPITDLVKLTGQLMGFNRITANVDTYIRAALSVAVEKSFLRIDGEKVVEIG